MVGFSHPTGLKCFGESVEPAARISGGLGPIRGGAIQSWISNGTTAMFEATP